MNGKKIKLTNFGKNMIFPTADHKSRMLLETFVIFYFSLCLLAVVEAN